MKNLREAAPFTVVLVLAGLSFLACTNAGPEADTGTPDVTAEITGSDLQNPPDETPVDAPTPDTDLGQEDIGVETIEDLPVVDVVQLDSTTDVSDLTEEDSVDVIEVDPCVENPCEEMTEATCEGDTLVEYNSGASCDGSTGEAVCTWEVAQETDCAEQGNICSLGSCVFPESTYTGNAVIHSQEDLESFQSYTEIDGGLIITGTFLEMVSLPHLHTVHGSLLIKENSALQEVHLSSLQTVHGLLYIWKNPSLWDLSLDSLTQVLSNFIFKDNDLIVALDLASLENITGGLNINGNLALQSMNLPGINEVGGNLDVYNNHYLQTINLPSLTHLGANMGVRNLPILQNLDLSALQTAVGSLRFSELPTLPSVDLPLLEVVDSDILIRSIGLLNEVQLPNLVEVKGTLAFANLTTLASISAPLFSQSGGLIFIEMPNLTNIDLSILETVDGPLVVGTCAMLESLSLPSLNSVTEALLVRNNELLADLQLANLQSLDGGLFVERNMVLLDLSFSSLTTISGPMMVAVNAALTQISMPILDQISGSLVVSENPSLETFSMPELAGLGLTEDWSYPKPVVSNVSLEPGSLITSVTILEEPKIFTAYDNTWYALTTLNTLDNSDLSLLTDDECTLGTAEVHLEVWITSVEYVLTTFELTIENNNYGIQAGVGDPPDGWQLGWNIWNVPIGANWYKCSGTCTSFCDINWSSMNRLELYRSGPQNNVLPEEIGLRNIQIRSHDLGNLLSGKNLAIVDNASLANLDMGSLAELNTVTISKNTALPQCLLDATSGSMLSETGVITTSENRQDCTCSDTKPVIATCPPLDPDPPAE